MIRPGGFDERFHDLGFAVWTASYLPAWSSRAAAAAHYTVEPDGLHLTIPPDHPLWCPDLHPTPLRVSAVQSANRSGPVGSMVFGDTAEGGRAAVGSGIHAFRDPRLVEEFSADHDRCHASPPVRRRLAAGPGRVPRRRRAHARARAGAGLHDADHPRRLRLPGPPGGRRPGRPGTGRA